MKHSHLVSEQGSGCFRFKEQAMNRRRCDFFKRSLSEREGILKHCRPQIPLIDRAIPLFVPFVSLMVINFPMSVFHDRSLTIHVHLHHRSNYGVDTIKLRPVKGQLKTTWRCKISWKSKNRAATVAKNI